jgi:hypothetical protein
MAAHENIVFATTGVDPRNLIHVAFIFCMVYF